MWVLKMKQEAKGIEAFTMTTVIYVEGKVESIHLNTKEIMTAQCNTIPTHLK